MSGVPDSTPDTEGEGTWIPNGRWAPCPRPPEGQKDSGDDQADPQQPNTL